MRNARQEIAAQPVLRGYTTTGCLFQRFINKRDLFTVLQYNHRIRLFVAINNAERKIKGHVKRMDPQITFKTAPHVFVDKPNFGSTPANFGVLSSIFCVFQNIARRH